MKFAEFLVITIAVLASVNTVCADEKISHHADIDSSVDVEYERHEVVDLDALHLRPDQMIMLHNIKKVMENKADILRQQMSGLQQEYYNQVMFILDDEQRDIFIDMRLKEKASKDRMSKKNVARKIKHKHDKPRRTSSKEDDSSHEMVDIEAM